MTNTFIHIPVELYVADVIVYLDQKEFDIKKAHSIIRKSVSNCKDPKQSFKDITESFIDAHKKHFVDNGYGGIATSNGNVYMVVVSDFDFLSAKFHGILAHELLHITDRILLDCGMPHTMDSCEGYTYLLEHLSRKCYEHMLNHHKKHILTGEK